MLEHARAPSRVRAQISSARLRGIAREVSSDSQMGACRRGMDAFASRQEAPTLRAGERRGLRTW
eukprot:6197448-Pleurochrysis_carterae.AAC.2